MIALTLARRLLTPLLPWALAATTAALGLQTLRLASERTAHANTRAAHFAALQDMERTAREATSAARIESERRLYQTLEIAHETENRLARARADAAASAAVGHRLRQQITALTATCGGGGTRDSGSSTTGEAADATSDLLADVQRRLDDASDRIAAFADQAHIAGLACERIHNGLIGR